MAGGGIGNMLDVSRRALFAQTQAIRVTGNNIANVNTPGYSRRKAELESIGPTYGGGDIAVGNGVNVNRVIRLVDKYLIREYRDRVNEVGKENVRNEFLSRAEDPFSLADTTGKIGSELSNFFSSLRDLAESPSDLPLRTKVIEAGRSLADSISTTFNHLADLQREADNRLNIIVTDINRLTSQIAEANANIAASEYTDQENLTLRDKRDSLLEELSQKIKINTVENSQGIISVSLDNGFGLVSETTAKTLEYTQTPSFGTFENGLDGGPMGHIVYDFDPTASASHIDLTNIVASGDGEIAGLLAIRGIQSSTDTSPFDAVGDIPAVASRVEALTRTLLTTFNQTYLGQSDETAGGAFDPSSGDLNGNTPGVYGLFGFSGSTDSDADGLPDDLAAIGFDNYSSILEFNVTDPANLAGSWDLDATAGVLSFAPGDGRNIESLANLRDTAFSYSVGNFTGSSTLEELYQSTVSYVGGLKNAAQARFEIADSRRSQVEELKASASGVSLDEEFAKLINFQRAFEASARLIRVGDDLLNQIIRILG